MPDGFSIHRIAEYTPERFTAPSLLFEKRQKPSARYLVILISDTMGVPALGETVVQAVEAAIAKIKSL